jgi:glutaredoxin
MPFPTFRFRLAAASLAFAFVMVPALAGTMYKSIGPDGRTIYTDAPPADARNTRQIKGESLPSSPVPDEIRRFREEMLKSANLRSNIDHAPSSSNTLLYTAQWCGYCKKAKAYLGGRSIAYQEIDIETDTGKRAFAAVGGSSGIPLLILKGKRTSGFTREGYDELFADAASGARAATPARRP